MLINEQGRFDMQLEGAGKGHLCCIIFYPPKPGYPDFLSHSILLERSAYYGHSEVHAYILSKITA